MGNYEGNKDMKSYFYDDELWLDYLKRDFIETNKMRNQSLAFKAANKAPFFSTPADTGIGTDFKKLWEDSQ